MEGLLGIGLLIGISLIIMWVIDEFKFTVLLFVSSIVCGFLVYGGLLPLWSLTVSLVLMGLVGYFEIRNFFGGD